MKKVSVILGALLVAGWCSAAGLVDAIGIYQPVFEMPNPRGVDHVYLCHGANDVEFTTQSQQTADWYDVSSHRMVGMGYTTFINAESGHTYMVSSNGRRETFAVFDDAQFSLKDCRLRINPQCDSTIVTIENFKITSYIDTAGKTQYVERTMVLEYQNEIWNNESKAWETLPQSDTITGIDLSSFSCNKLLIDSDFKLKDLTLADKEDSISTDSTVVAIAVDNHQLYFIAKRGKTLENEKEGPYDDNTIIHSAPLDVLFESHPSAKADVYSWTIKRGKDVLSQRNDKDMRYIFDEASASGSVTYTVDLEVLNSDYPECVSTAQDTIVLNESFILVPNVFTPNGDGVNDEFRVAYRSICEFHCWVYNRWQHIVYQWDDPAKGWDGTYNGRKEPDSAYIYIIEATGCDGQRYKLKGTVNLLRGE